MSTVKTLNSQRRGVMKIYWNHQPKNIFIIAHYHVLSADTADSLVML